MVFEGIAPQEIADEWTQRVTQRMRELNMPKDEVEENGRIIHSFCLTAVELLKAEPYVKLPKRSENANLDNEKAHLIIDLFLRGVNQATRYLRSKGTDWETRKTMLESVSWQIFNLAKLLVALQLDPMPTFSALLKQDTDLKMMMKHSTDELVRKVLSESPAS